MHYYRGHLKCPPNFICGKSAMSQLGRRRRDGTGRRWEKVDTREEKKKEEEVVVVE